MKNKNKKQIACVFLVLLGQPAWCYEQLTHQELSVRAVKASGVEHPQLLADLGIEPGQFFPGSDRIQRTIPELIRDGADLEDEGWRPTNHFYDPHHDRPATVPPWLPVGVSVGETSPDWIVDGIDQEDGEFSVKGARGAFIEGLAGPGPDERNRAWGWMFQSLGHVIHHLQDMAQPQHVRNDIHYINEFVATHFGDALRLAWEDRSWFEKYSLENSAVWQASAPAAPAPVNFSRAREFWVTLEGRGIAQFTNANFVSSDTNFTYAYDGRAAPARDYPLPHPAGRNTRSVRDPALGITNADDLCARLTMHPIARFRDCEIDFVETVVIDEYNGGTRVPNDRAASFSVFDAQLREIDNSRLGLGLFTLNSINFKAAYRFLIPKAINYSAGMINHFFRGRLQLRNTEVRDGWITAEIANVSAAGNHFSDGQFWIHYDSFSGTRKPLASEAGGLQVGATRQLRFAVPWDLDLRAQNPLALVFEGRIGGDAGVSGLVFDVPDVVSGFVVGTSAPRLIRRLQGQWQLHPQELLPRGGAVDWKGWYVDGKPTRMLTWDGWRYAKLVEPAPVRTPNIYAAGKPMAVAPWPVLGAALQKDADGNAWIVAICEDATLDQDVVIRRPARKSKSAALYDAATAPDGWRVLGRFPRPEHLSKARESWQFNGDGTEAQTMRARSYNGDPSRAPYTRLKAILSGEAVAFEDLGNTRGTRIFVNDVTASSTRDGRTYDYCYGSGTVDATSTVTTTGSPVVAVDYIDDREVLARIEVEGLTAGTEHGSGGFAGRSVDASRTATLRWTFDIDGARHELSTDDEVHRTRYDSTENYLLDTSRRMLVRGAIVALDLRSGLVLIRRSREEILMETVDPTLPNGPSAGSTSIHRQYEMRGPGSALSPVVDVSSTATSSYQNGWVGTMTYECARSQLVPSGRTTREESFDLNVLSGHVGYKRFSDMVSSATDRSGNVFVSMRHLDEVTKQLHVLNYLTGGDPVAVLGRDPQSPFAIEVRPR